jgi:hypothetical protein
MLPTIRIHGLVISNELRTRLQERLHAALDCYARRINAIDVFLRDLNGPRGGSGMQCRIVIEMTARRRVVVTGEDADLTRAVSQATHRATFAVQRRVERRFRSMRTASRHRAYVL